jgi:23S rRNA (cytosine1962-C5)-methyltransferase
MHTIHLNKGRDSSLLRHHPWIFSGAIRRVEGDPAPGETVLVRDSGGNRIALAAWSPSSQIRARAWSFDAAVEIDAGFFKARIELAVARRRGMRDDAQRSAYRLVYGESDGLPGLIVDRYGDFLICQFLFTGVERWKQEIVAALAGAQPCRGIYERSDVAIRAREGMEQTSGLLWGEMPPELLEINERGRLYGVNVFTGHKTGFYLDQFDNREIVRTLCSGRSVLNCFSYTGAFGVAALQGGAQQVTNVDSSAPALAQAVDNFARNGFTPAQYENVNANVFELLREYRQSGRRFDLVILDPPKFAETKAQFSKAARAYKDIALLAAGLLNPQGYLVNFSCSGAIDLPLFQKITADALLDAGRQGQIVRYLHQSDDHPVGLPFPESLYLKGLVCLLD